MEWNDNTDLNKMDYSLRRFGSETALLISLTSTYLSWNKLDMGILLSSSEVRN